MVGEEDEGRLEDTTEIGNAGEMILLEKAHRSEETCHHWPPFTQCGKLESFRAVHAYAMQGLRTQ